MVRQIKSFSTDFHTRQGASGKGLYLRTRETPFRDQKGAVLVVQGLLLSFGLCNDSRELALLFTT